MLLIIQERKDANYCRYRIQPSIMTFKAGIEENKISLGTEYYSDSRYFHILGETKDKTNHRS